MKQLTNHALGTAWDYCTACKGSGLQDGLYGPVDCWECKGNIMVRVRDEKGRFTTKAVDLSSEHKTEARASKNHALGEAV